ncbi:Hypothetical protein D9617_13g100610 [Elsinoe fawcettii]|nr:Hypothetical protein D9617_13g100610 [Elsinoe fawcettii]
MAGVSVDDTEEIIDRWERAVRAAFYQIPDRQDRELVTFQNSWRKIRALISGIDTTSSPDLSSLPFVVRKLAVFHQQRLLACLQGDDSTFYRGIIWLAIKVVAEESIVTQWASSHLSELSRQLHSFSEQRADEPELDSRMKDECVTGGIAIVDFCAQIIRNIRNDQDTGTNGSKSKAKWERLESSYEAAKQNLQGAFSRFESFANMAEYQRQIEGAIDRRMRLPVLMKRDRARTPIFWPPGQAKSFFDREREIQDIETHFNTHIGDQTFRSLAIYGLAGLGKTSVALKYARLQWDKQRIDNLLWIVSETPTSIRQSFTLAALRLKLEGARPDDHDENRARLLDWLQTTDDRWLIIYDNATKVDILERYWPSGGYGQALITTRNPDFEFRFADKGIELKSWDAHTGTLFLEHLFSTDIGKTIKLEGREADMARELSVQMEGHALAISLMAGLIHRRAWSIQDFYTMYNERPGEMMVGISENKSINALWKYAFRSLGNDSAILLGVMSFLQSDGIPQVMFEPQTLRRMPERLVFCHDPIKRWDALDMLITQALLKRDKDTQTFVLHRLVQLSFKHFMSTQERQQCFAEATELVSRAFPRRENDSATLWLKWKGCADHLQHVLFLRDCLEQEWKESHQIVATATYCDLSNACQRYLIEVNSYDELQDLVSTNLKAIETLPESEQTVALRGSLTSHQGQLLCRQHRLADGIKCLRRSYDIRKEDNPFRHEESAWAASNLAEAYATCDEKDEASKWVKQCRRHWKDWTSSKDLGEKNWPANAKSSLGVILSWIDKIDEARDMLLEAAEQFKDSSPVNWAASAYNYLALGRLARKDGDFAVAEKYFMQAQNSWLKGDHKRTASLNGSCLYRLGCVTLDQGNVDAAVKHLRDAVVVTEIRMRILVGEHARVLFKLSEALYQKNDEIVEANRLRNEAESLIRTLQSDASDLNQEQTYDSYVGVMWR